MLLVVYNASNRGRPGGDMGRLVDLGCKAGRFVITPGLAA